MTETPVETPTLPSPTPEGATLRERALKDILIQVAARVANLALGVVVTALLARTLGDTGFGQWATIATAFQLVGFFTSLGLESVAVRQAAMEPERAPTWLGALVVTRIALTLPAMGVALLVLLLVQEERAMLIAGLVLLLQFPFSIAGSMQVVHQLRMRNSMPMVLLTVNSVVWGVCVLVIDLRGGGLVALAVALTATNALTCSLQAYTALRLVGQRLHSSGPAVRELLRLGAPLGLAGLLVNAYARVDQIIVYEQAGAAQAGLYGSVYRVLEQAHFVPVSVLTTLAPLIASLWPHDRERMLRIVGLAARLLAVGSFGALAFVIVGAKPVVRLIFGEEFVPGATALPVLGGAFVFICFGYLIGNLLLVLGLAGRQVIVATVGLVVNVVGNLLLVPRYGYMGAAWMTLVTEMAVVGVSGWFVIRRLEIRRVDPGPIVRIALAALGLGLLLAGCSVAGAPLAVLIVVACTAYPASLLALGAIDLGEIREVLVRRPSPA